MAGVYGGSSGVWDVASLRGDSLTLIDWGLEALIGNMGEDGVFSDTTCMTVK